MGKLHDEVLQFIAKPRSCQKIAEKFSVSTFDAKAIINILVSENKAAQVHGKTPAQFATKAYVFAHAKKINANKGSHGIKTRKRYG